ncbi:MAG: DUF1599 domain-containing protein [Porphyromonadaceae bacterium]|nr:MAG: DUF1599 domain-containing protein [Porphyromonadaceae bacterium]
MQKTLSQYNQIVTLCRDIFEKKMKDYGASWRILRAESVTDQIYIKAQRIQSIEQKKTQMIGDDIRSEFIGIVNYSIIGLIQIEANDGLPVNLEPAQALSLYNSQFDRVRALMMAKNHDYGEAWRSMRISSFTDLILMKIYRTKQIEDHLGQTMVSEGIDANYMDMINYAIFALIKIDFKD